jgi:hypothetical protein
MYGFCFYKNFKETTTLFFVVLSSFNVLIVYCLEGAQLIDNQLVARFIIVECTDKYHGIYG